jgi:hypothetical protein
VGVLIIANLANFDEGGKTGLEGAKNIDPNKNFHYIQQNTIWHIK